MPRRSLTCGFSAAEKGDLKTDNKRNGHSSKNLKSQYGEFQIDVPRDRNGEFEPKLIPKYQRDISSIVSVLALANSSVASKFAKSA